MRRQLINLPGMHGEVTFVPAKELGTTNRRTIRSRVIGKLSDAEARVLAHELSWRHRAQNGGLGDSNGSQRVLVFGERAVYEIDLVATYPCIYTFRHEEFIPLITQIACFKRFTR